MRDGLGVAVLDLGVSGGNEVSKYEEPSGEGVRVDAALYAGGKPSMHYVHCGMSSKLQQQWPVCQLCVREISWLCQDPLVGKLICYAPGQGMVILVPDIATLIPLVRIMVLNPHFVGSVTLM